MISVVIPLYNKQESIVATLQSVLAQTYQNFEIVVVDDGSMDNSAQVVEEFISAYPQPLPKGKGVRLVRKANGGVSSARNRGILEAKGEYIAFLDGDDLWNEKYLETLHQLIIDYPDASIYGIGRVQIKDGDTFAKHTDTNCRGYVEDVWKNYPGYWTSSSCSSRAHLIEIGMFDTRMTHGEDLDVWWRLLLRGKGAYDSTVLAYYRQDAENRAMNRVIPLDKHIPFYLDKYAEARASNKEFRRFFDREMIYRLYPYLFDKRYRKQAKLLAKQLDYSLQKWTMKFRMIWPYMYKLYTKIKG